MNNNTLYKNTLNSVEYLNQENKNQDLEIRSNVSNEHLKYQKTIRKGLKKYYKLRDEWSIK